jgi:transcriptional regulator with XRE-family HTH domain
MARNERTHVFNDAKKEETPMAPKMLTKQEFGRRLYQLMIAKGWRQSDLARRADIQRDSVSTYVRGVTWPSQINLEKLAKALDVEPNDLLPNGFGMAVAQDEPDFELKVSPGDPTMAWLRINRMVPFDIAVEIAAILNRTPHSLTKDV